MFPNRIVACILCLYSYRN